MIARATATLRATPYGAWPWYLRALVGSILVAGLLALVIGLIETFGSATDKRVALTFLVNLVIVIGIQTFMGNSGIVTFGHVAFVGIGAYAAGLMTVPPITKESMLPNAPGFIQSADLGFLPATLVAVAVVGLFAFVIGFAFVRLSGASAAIATLALLVIVRTVIAGWDDITRGAKTFFGLPDHTTVGWALGWCVVVILLARLFRESGVGLRLRATRTDPLVARAVGTDINRARLAAWTASAMIAAVGGVLYAHFLGSFAPEQFFFEFTFLLLVMVIVGGPTISGAVVGAGAVTLAAELLRRLERGFTVGPIDVGEAFGLTTIVLGAAVLGAMILRPNGLLGRWELDELLVRLLRFSPRGWRAREEGEAPERHGPHMSTSAGTTGARRRS